MKEHEETAKQYLKYIYRPHYAGKFERKEILEMFNWLADKGYIIQSIVSVPDEWWDDILERSK